MPKREVLGLNGYRMVFEPGHPRSVRSGGYCGYVYEHILVAEKFLGRPMLENEVCHHLDGNRSNNRIENVIVLLRNQHNKLHEWLKRGAPRVKAPGEKGMNSGKSKAVDPSYCESCGRTLQRKNRRFCSRECHEQNRPRACERPSANELKKDMGSMSWLAMGRKYGVSDNAVRKWARRYELL